MPKTAKSTLSHRQKELLVWIERSSTQDDAGPYFCPAVGHPVYLAELDREISLYYPRDMTTISSLYERGLVKRVYRGDMILPRYACRITEDGAVEVSRLVEEGFAT